MNSTVLRRMNRMKSRPLFFITLLQLLPLRGRELPSLQASAAERRTRYRGGESRPRPDPVISGK
jgi:hypothetical protein